MELGWGAVGSEVVVCDTNKVVRGHFDSRFCSPTTARPAATLHGQVVQEGQGLGRVSQGGIVVALAKGSPKWWQGTLPG